MPGIELYYYNKKDTSYVNKYFVDPLDESAQRIMENKKIIKNAKKLTHKFQRLGMLEYPKNYIRYPE